MNGGIIIPKWQILGSSPSPVGPNKLEVSLNTKKQGKLNYVGKVYNEYVSFNFLFSTSFDVKLGSLFFLSERLSMIS